MPLAVGIAVLLLSERIRLRSSQRRDKVTAQASQAAKSAHLTRRAEKPGVQYILPGRSSVYRTFSPWKIFLFRLRCSLAGLFSSLLLAIAFLAIADPPSDDMTIHPSLIGCILGAIVLTTVLTEEPTRRLMVGRALCFLFCGVGGSIFGAALAQTLLTPGPWLLLVITATCACISIALGEVLCGGTLVDFRLAFLAASIGAFLGAFLIPQVFFFSWAGIALVSELFDLPINMEIATWSLHPWGFTGLLSCGAATAGLVVGLGLADNWTCKESPPSVSGHSSLKGVAG